MFCRMCRPWPRPGFRNTILPPGPGWSPPPIRPPAIVDRLFKEITKALNQPAVREAFAKQAMIVKPNESPEAFRQFIKNEIDRIRKVVQAADIKPEG